MMAGKPTAGLVRLSAAHLAGRVQIEVRDDGRGLNPQKLRTKAVEKGLITADQAARLSDADACQLIFAAGFSTAEQLSDVSGRGVGMDVVKTNIEKLGGRVELESEPGQGTAIIIRLPLTLAIIPALIVGCGGRKFAVPQLNLEEIIQPGPDSPLEPFGGSEVLRLREELLPILDLATLLGHPPRLVAEGESAPSRFVLVLKLDHRRYGLVVDEIASTEEIVVKPLGRHIKGVSLYSGATLLGQGEIGLILDPAGLAAGRLPAESETASVRSLADAASIGNGESILLFRDGSRETFALHLANIGRVERIETTRIERVGQFDYLRQKDGTTIRLLRLHDFLPTSGAGMLGDEIHVIIPRLTRQPVGIIAEEILDSDELRPGALDTTTITAPGLLGTASLQDRLTMIIDFYGLLQVAGFDMSQSSHSELQSVRVLLAEDTAFFREAVTRGLRDIVARIDIANNGEDAWRRLQEQSYDVLITDIEMPVLDGFSLTKRIREDERLHNLPVIALSSRGNEDALAKAKQVGINHYETKLDRERLCKAVEEVLHTAHQPALPSA